MTAKLLTISLLGLLSSFSVSAQSVSADPCQIGSRSLPVPQFHSLRIAADSLVPQYSTSFISAGNSTSLIPPSAWTPGISISDFFRPSQPFLTSKLAVNSLPSAPAFTNFPVIGPNLWQTLGIIGLGIAQQFLDQTGAYPDL